VIARATRVLLAALPVLLSAGGPAAARDYYVAGSHRTASDENSGTDVEHPLRTISAGVARAMPGDTVWVDSGTYRETVVLARSGESEARRIRISARKGASVAIKGSDRVTGWLPVKGGAGGGLGIWKRRGWTANSQQVFVDGEPLRQIGATCPFHSMRWGREPILPTTGRGLSDMPPGSFFYDRKEAALHVRLADGGDPSAHLVEASVRDHVIAAGPVSFIELRDLAFSHSNTSAAPRMMGLVNIEGRGWLVTGCSFTYGDFAGLSVSGTGHRILRNVCNHNGNVGIAVNGSDAAHGWSPYPGRPPQDILLEGNETSYNNYRGFHVYFQAGGLKAASSCNGVRVLRHTARSNAGPGIWFDLGCRDVTVEGCVLADNTRGVEFEISDHALISGNLVTGSSTQGIYVSASSDVTVSNNTLDGNAYGIVVHGLPRPEHPELRNNTVRNNIVADSAEADLVLFHGGPEAAGNSSDFNLFHRRGGGVRISWTDDARYGITHASLQSFARDTGHDRHSSTGDPRWVNRSSGDYRLAAGSPAIAAGWNGDGEGAPPERSGAASRRPDAGAFPSSDPPTGPRPPCPRAGGARGRGHPR
jgi:parallel beta-helix repeat protein